MNHQKSGILIAVGAVFLAIVVTTVSVATAARNASGTMVKINGPYTAGTTISSSIINNRYADIESEITDSLSRSGKGGMTAAILGSDGTVVSPAYSWTSEPGTGLYRIGAGDVGFAVSGVKKHEWIATGETITGTLAVSGLSTFADGVVGLPGISFGAENTSGFYRNAAADLRLSVTNTNVQRWGINYSIFPTGTGLRLDGTTLPSNAGFWAGTPAGTPTTSNYFLAADGSATTTLNAPTTVQLNIAGATIAKATAAGFTIGSTGTAISASYRATANWTPGLLAAGACSSVVITVTGAVAGADCIPSQTFINAQFFPPTCWVTTNTCTLAMCNQSSAGFTPPGGVYACRVLNP